MFRDGAFRERHCGFRIEVSNWGWSFGPDGLYSTLATMVDGPERLFGQRLRTRLGEVVPRQFRLALEMEQIPEESNYVTIDTQYRDRLGNFRPVIRYDLPDYVRAGMAAAEGGLRPGVRPGSAFRRCVWTPPRGAWTTRTCSPSRGTTPGTSRPIPGT